VEEEHHSLRNGSRLNQYKILRILGAGGFGITYLAEDMELDLKVVIKEYFPNEYAVRKSDNTIISKTSSKDEYINGMKRFKEEAKTLAKFNHPSIVKILGYFELNNTAYFVMEYEEGVDLSAYLKEKGKGIGEEEILGIMMPVLEGLKEVHKYNYLHRDIKPGNILLRKDKSPVLIDFGASKLALGEASKSITSMLTEGYAPLEQYSTDVKKQGAFTDLYAIAAVIYKMITGEVPPSAQTRSYALLSGERDPYNALSDLNLKGYDNNFLTAVDRSLAISAKERPQSVEEFQSNIIELSHVETRETEPPSDKKKSSLLLVMIIGILIAIGISSFIFYSPEVIVDGNSTKDLEPIIKPKNEKNKTSIPKREVVDEEKIVVISWYSSN